MKKRAKELKYNEHHQNQSLPCDKCNSLLPADDCCNSDDEVSERVQYRKIPNGSKDIYILNTVRK